MPRCACGAARLLRFSGESERRDGLGEPDSDVSSGLVGNSNKAWSALIISRKAKETKLEILGFLNTLTGKINFCELIGLCFAGRSIRKNIVLQVPAVRAAFYGRLGTVTFQVSTPVDRSGGCEARALRISHASGTADPPLYSRTPTLINRHYAHSAARGSRPSCCTPPVTVTNQVKFNALPLQGDCKAACPGVAAA